MAESEKEACILARQFKQQREFLELRDLLPGRVVVSEWGRRYIRKVYQPIKGPLHFFGYRVVIAEGIQKTELLVVPDYSD